MAGLGGTYLPRSMCFLVVKKRTSSTFPCLRPSEAIALPPGGQNCWAKCACTRDEAIYSDHALYNGKDFTVASADLRGNPPLRCRKALGPPRGGVPYPTPVATDHPPSHRASALSAERERPACSPTPPSSNPCHAPPAPPTGWLSTGRRGRASASSSGRAPG